MVVKLSDFGLYKDPHREMTSTGSAMKGTLIDPTLDNFADFDMPAEIYAVGHILSFIFSGRVNIGGCEPQVQEIVNGCIDHDRAARFTSVHAIIKEIEKIGVEGATVTA